MENEVKLYLDVPYAEKDAAKLLGAKWDPKIKLWFIEAKEKIDKSIEKWLIQQSSYDLFAENYSIVTAYKPCWKCGQRILVSTFYIENYYSLDEYPSNTSDGFIMNWDQLQNKSFVSNIINIDAKNLEQIQKVNPYYKKTFSKTIGGSYFANNCSCCGVLQGDFNLYDEPDGVFFDYRAQQKFSESIKINSIFKADGSTSFITGY